jgi:hypothetical protein
MLGAAVGARVQGILAIERDWTDGSLDNFGIDFDAAVPPPPFSALP